MDEPTLYQALIAGLGIIFFTINFFRNAIPHWKDKWRTRGGKTKYYWAYGKQNCNMHFITGYGDRH